MKTKFILFIILLLSVFGLVSCGEEEQTEIDDFDIPSYPCFTTDKKVYKKGEKINVKLYNTEGCKKVVLTEYGREPTALYDINFRKIEDSNELSFNTHKLENVGDFTLWLCGEGNYDYIYTLDIHIDDEDDNDYQITNANIIKENVSNSLKYSININTNHLEELTYRLYWCKDGVRLNDYMALSTVKSSGKSNFKIDLPYNIIAPDEANQIEVSVVEGVSTSYYFDSSVISKKPESKYLFTFNAISDLHVQSLKDSMVFNAHLKTTLNDIYQSDSKALFAVGDIVNFGKEEEYVFFKSVYDSVSNPNNIPFYPAIGNHEYMYFSSFDEPLGYFKKQYNLESHYYSVMIDNIKFIVLGTDTSSMYGVMSTAELNWLEAELSSVGKNDKVFIFMHQPLKDTVDGTLYTTANQTSYGFIENNDKLRSIFKNYPNAFIFSGHSHQTLEGLTPVLYGNGSDATFINCGSNGYLCQYIDGLDLDDVGGSEGQYVEIYEDYVIIRGREFSYGKWVSNCQILLPLNK